MTAYLRVKNWERFQHYTNRSPPWIKLHRELLTSMTWVASDDASRTLAIACMLLASATDNRIPADKAYLRRVAYLNSDPDWVPLLQSDFIEIVDESGTVLAPASTLLANRTECSSEERREETEQSRGEEIRTTAAAPPRVNGHDVKVKTSSRGTRVPIPFPVTDEMRDWVKSETPDVDVDGGTTEFVDYWRAVPGQKGCKLDWLATWRNRMRTLQGIAHPQRRKTRFEQAQEALDRATAAE